jgi:L-ascorbate metabolism protein UlaG (beta-lactamase superfamily)
MRLTKYRHSCVRLEDGDNTLVIDPGTYSESEIALQDVDVILITHEHMDHIDENVVRTHFQTNTRVNMYAPASVTASFEEFADRVHTVEAGQTFEAAGFHISTFGGEHAVIHPQIPVVANICYLINKTVYCPGDSFFVPPASMPIVLVPIHAPWSKFAEVADFLLEIKAKKAYQIHDGLLNDVGIQITEKNIERVTGSQGVRFEHLHSGQTVEV